MRRERGLVVVMFAVTLVVLLLFAAFAIDLGLLYNERRHDQNAADAAISSGGIALLSEQTLQDAVDEITAKVADNLGRPVTEAEWASCADAGELHHTALSRGLHPRTRCISFSPAFDVLRVRVPDQGVETAFARVVGIDELSSSAFAEVTIHSRGGGALPFVVLAHAASGDQICLRTDGTGGEEPPDQLGVDPFTVRQPDPCNRENFLTHDGGRGTLRPWFYDGCSKSTGNQSIVSAIMAGMDHPLGVFRSDITLSPGDNANHLDSHPEARLDGAGGCTTVLPNTVDVDTGLTAHLLQCSLLENPCNAGGPATDGKPGRLHSPGSGASFAGRPLDDTALWDFFVHPLPGAAPGSCSVAAGGGDLYTRRAALQHCLASWQSSWGPLFVEEVASAPRFGFVPRIAELGLCRTQPDPFDPSKHACKGPLDNVHITGFAPVYIDGLYEDKAGECDPSNPSTGETSWSIHYPGAGLDCGNKRVERISGLVLPCGALPREVCDPGSNPPFPTTVGIMDVALSR